jgi:hypothetical protein
VFAAPEKYLLRKENIYPPWEQLHGNVEYVQSGRQALAVIIKLLSARNFSSVAVPNFLCDSMLEPFVRAGWEINTYQLDRELKPVPQSITEVVKNNLPSIAVLGVNYFGRLPEQNYVNLVSELASIGIPVIEDETHRIFTPGQVGAEFAFGSLRKLLPIADGAYIRHSQQQPITQNLIPGDTSILWSEMQEMQIATAEVELQLSRRRVQLANKSFEEIYEPKAISQDSFFYVKNLDYEAMQQKRIANGNYLGEKLNKMNVPMLNLFNDSQVPSHLIIEVKNPKEIQKRMAEQRVYCPIHYPRSQILQHNMPWRENILSLPIDHRYDESDMDYIIMALKKSEIS